MKFGFVVRLLTLDSNRTVVGRVEHFCSGRKARFHTLDELAEFFRTCVANEQDSEERPKAPTTDTETPTSSTDAGYCSGVRR